MEAYSQTSKRETAPAPCSDQEKRARPLDAAGIGWLFCQYSLFEPSATISKTLCVLRGFVRLRTYHRRAQKYGDRVLIFINLGARLWVGKGKGGGHAREATSLRPSSRGSRTPG